MNRKIPNKMLRIKRPSHNKQMLANACSQTQIGVCDMYVNDTTTCWQSGAKNKTRLYFRQLFPNFLLCRSHSAIVGQHLFVVRRWLKSTIVHPGERIRCTIILLRNSWNIVVDLP